MARRGRPGTVWNPSAVPEWGSGHLRRDDDGPAAWVG